MSGWVKIHRAVIDHPMFQGHADWLGGWIWIIGQACWKPTKYRLGKETIILERGQFVTTLARMRDETGLGIKQIRGLMGRLESDRMIDTHRGKHGTLITVCNYEKYQGDEVMGGTPEGTRGAHEGHTKEEGKKGRRENRPIDKPDLFAVNGSPPTSESAFDRWWKIYPRKEAKKDAEEAFRAAVKKVGVEDLIRATQNYADHCRQNGTETRFIKLPAGWLRKERWEDWQQAHQQQSNAPEGFELIAGTLIRKRGAR